MTTVTQSVKAGPTGDTAGPTQRVRRKSHYPLWFLLPAAVLFFVLFLLPTFASFFFSLTRWTLFDWTFIGLDNFVAFFEEEALIKGLVNTLIYATVTSGAEGGPGPAAGPATHLADHRSRFPTLGQLLPGAGQHHRRRHHLPGAAEPDQGPGQPGARLRRHRRDRRGWSTREPRCCRWPWSTSGRASGWPR